MIYDEDMRCYICDTCKTTIQDKPDTPETNNPKLMANIGKLAERIDELKMVDLESQICEILERYFGNPYDTSYKKYVVGAVAEIVVLLGKEGR
jgi:hypothetical protein